jgi:hypothetical protein
VRVPGLGEGDPARSVIVVERVAHAREQAQRETYQRLAPELTEARCAGLDALLEVDPQIGMTRLRWIATGPVDASPAGVRAEVDKLEHLRGLGAHTLDLSVLPAERRRFLATIGRRLTGLALARREPERRYPILLTLLAQIGPCGHRLGIPTSSGSCLDGGTHQQLLGFQQRLLDYLQSNGPQPVLSVGQETTSPRYLVDLRILSCLITASWPAARDLLTEQQALLLDTHARDTHRHLALVASLPEMDGQVS